MMFNPTTHIIDSFVQRMQQEYWQTYSTLEPAYPGILAWAGHMALEHIASSDALYHNVEHTIMVTLVGQEILKGKHWREGGVTPQVWLHVIISLLYHDVGFVRGLCQDDCDRLHCPRDYRVVRCLTRIMHEGELLRSRIGCCLC